MSTTIPSRLDESRDPAAAGAERSEPGGRAKRGGGGGRLAGRPELAAELKALLPDELLDELLAGAQTEEEITGPGGLLSQLTKRLGTRIARDLHDSVGHALNVILVQAGAARLLRDRDPDRSVTALETIEDVARQTITEIDGLVRALREGELANGRVEAQPGLAALDTLIAQHRLAGLEVTVHREGDTRSLPRRVNQAAYRILQEALTNATRHGTGSAELDLCTSKRELELTVRNPVANGATEGHGQGHGLIGMRERAELLAGTLSAEAADGEFVLRVALPLDGDADA